MKRALIAVALAAACDPQANAVGDGVRGMSDDQLSRERESCGSSLDCAPGLRCLDQRCVPTQSSVLGELYTQVGAAALESGDWEAAIEAYGRAVNQYEADKVVAPAALYCAHGHALVEDRGEPTRGELAARVLHKCLLDAPVGSPLRARALRDLALLLEVGLDPLLLARDAPADRYLTKQPQVPDADEVKVTVRAQGRAPRSRTFGDWLEVLKGPKVKAAVVPCWQAYWKETREDSLRVQLPLRYTYRLDQYDDFDRSILTIDPEVTGTDPRAQEVKCIASAVAPLADEYSKGAAESSWRTDVELVIAER